MAIAVAAVAAPVVLLFDVSFAPQLQLPAERQVPDPDQEAAFAACYAERDRELHEVAFGTIDNPDVQREFIATERDNAAAACRDEFPRKTVTESLPFEINLLDLDYRYD